MACIFCFRSLVCSETRMVEVAAGEDLSLLLKEDGELITLHEEQVEDDGAW